MPRLLILARIVSDDSTDHVEENSHDTFPGGRRLAL